MKKFIRYKTYLKTRSIQHINTRVLNLKRPKFKRLKKAVARKYRISRFYRAKLIRTRPVLYRQERKRSTPFKVDEWIRNRYYKPVQQFLRSTLKKRRRISRLTKITNVNRKLNSLNLRIKYAKKLLRKSKKLLNKKHMLTYIDDVSSDLVSPTSSPVVKERTVNSQNSVAADNFEQVIDPLKKDIKNRKSPARGDLTEKVSKDGKKPSNPKKKASKVKPNLIDNPSNSKSDPKGRKPSKDVNKKKKAEAKEEPLPKVSKKAPRSVKKPQQTEEIEVLKKPKGSKAPKAPKASETTKVVQPKKAKKPKGASSKPDKTPGPVGVE